MKRNTASKYFYVVYARMKKPILFIFILFICSSAYVSAQVIKAVVYFDFGKNELPIPEKMRLLYFLSDSIQNKAEYFIQIKGYCDNIDDDAFNNVLSRERAEAVRQVIISNGYAENAITLCEGYGEKIALNKNADEEERKVNRRVDIFFIPQTMSAQELQSFELQNSGKMKVLKDSLRAEDLEQGTTLILENLNFQPGHHKLLPKSVPTLKQLLKVMQENPNLEIEIVGHICCESNKAIDGMDADTHKLELSYNRAKEIMEFLVKNGIDGERMTISGKGATQKLIEPEITAQDMETNRRVEIIIKKQ